VLWTDVCSRAQVTRAIYIGTAYGPTHLARLVSWARQHLSRSLFSLSKNARSIIERWWNAFLFWGLVLL